jgi:flagellar protein FlaF
MGFEVSVVVVILFISAVILGTLSYTTLTTSAEIEADASAQQHEMQSKSLNTDIEIDNAIAGVFNGTYDLTVTMTNTGSETLSFDELNVLVDGSIEDYTFSDTTMTWVPEETRNLTVSGLEGTGNHRVKVVTENGVADYSTFIV